MLDRRASPVRVFQNPRSAPLWPNAEVTRWEYCLRSIIYWYILYWLSWGKQFKMILQGVRLSWIPTLEKILKLMYAIIESPIVVFNQLNICNKHSKVVQKCFNTSRKQKNLDPLIYIYLLYENKICTSLFFIRSKKCIWHSKVTY